MSHTPVVGEAWFRFPPAFARAGSAGAAVSPTESWHGRTHGVAHIVELCTGQLHTCRCTCAHVDMCTCCVCLQVCTSGCVCTDMQVCANLGVEVHVNVHAQVCQHLCAHG